MVYPEQRHVDYWKGYSLPVIMVVHDPAVRATYWEVISDATIEKTDARWKVIAPRDQRLDAGAYVRLLAIAAEGPEPDEAISTINRLRADLSWMEILDQGGSVVLEADEWINKTSGRGDLRLIAELADGGDRLKRQFLVFLGLAPYDEALPRLFPWANLDMDEHALNFLADPDWLGGTSNRGRLRPYAESGGEIERWRLNLELNDLGRGVLALERFMSGG